MKKHPLPALVLLLLFASFANADVGPPPPRYVEGASDTRVYAQNFIFLGLILAGIPIAVGLSVARLTPRWGYRLAGVFMAGIAGFVLLIVAYLGGLFITNDPNSVRNRNRPPRPVPTQPAELLPEPTVK